MTTKKNKTAVVDPTDLDVNLPPQDADWASLSAEADMDALGFPEDDLGPIGAPDDAAFGLDDFPEAFPAFGDVPAEDFGAETAAQPAPAPAPEETPEETPEPASKPARARASARSAAVHASVPAKPAREPASDAALEAQAEGVRVEPASPDVDPDNFDVKTAPLCTPTLLEASAGTGKTYSIKHLVLRLVVERNMRIDQLLVVTFTKDATAELAMRIREHMTDAYRALEALIRRAADEGGPADPASLTLEPAVEPIVNEQIALWRAWGLSDEEALRRIRASLTRFDDAAIHTIHAFCQKMLSNRAFSAGAPFGFEKGDDDAIADVMREVVEDFLRRKLDAEPDEDGRKALAALPWTEILENCVRLPAALVPREIPDKELDPKLRKTIFEFIDRAPEAVREAKHKRRIFSFDDLLTDLWRTLKEESPDGRPGPFARSLRRAFTGVLIDEFQDTDPVQFDIMRRLFIEGLSEREKSERALFFVGDPKQAIYHFRGADLNTYLEARDLIDQIGGRRRLGRNFRSSKGLVEAVNGFFGTVTGEGAFLRRELAYAPVDAGSKRPGLVRFTDAGVAFEEDPFEVWNSPVPYGVAADRKNDGGEAVARHIARLLTDAREGKVFVPATEKPEVPGTRDVEVNGRTVRMRPVEARDVAILVRKRDAALETMEALTRLGVRSRIKQVDDVMDTPEALEMEILLRALRRPDNVNDVNGARATRIFGETLSTIDAADEARRVEARTLLEDALKLWPRGGAAAVIREIMRARDTVRRILPTALGERTLTNYDHLTELIHAASRTHRTPSSLCAWFEAARGRSGGDERTLRLESEDNVVSVITIHSSKGLEYPIVYLPQGEGMTPSSKSKCAVWRVRRGGRTVLDIHAGAVSTDEALKQEEREELVRLAYVAMTRASSKLVLLIPQSRKSAKNPDEWISTTASNVYHLALLGELPGNWTEKERTDIDRRLASIPGVRVKNLMDEAHVPASPLEASPDTLTLSVDPAADVRARWATSSYTALARTIEDGDLPSKPRPASNPPDGTILTFGRGPRYGDALHRVMERADYALMAGEGDAAQEARIALCREIFDVTLPERGDAARLNELAGAGMLKSVLSTELLPGLRLADIPEGDRAAEMDFLLTIHPSVSADDLARALQRLGDACGRDYAVDGIEPRTLAGFLTGSIDLAVRAPDGRFWVLDWKSNALGPNAADYDQRALAIALREHHYRLQYLLYLVALRRFLAARLGDAFREEMIAGAAYVFIRGLDDTPLVEGRRTGVIVDRVPPAVVRTLDNLLQAGWNEADVCAAEEELARERPSEETL